MIPNAQFSVYDGDAFIPESYGYNITADDDVSLLVIRQISALQGGVRSLVVPLNLPGRYYFTCMVGVHCMLGQKVVVDVVNAANNSLYKRSLTMLQLRWRRAAEGEITHDLQTSTIDQ